MNEPVKKIRCSVGILTFNSAKTLRRTLESVKDFSDIIISDGGSTDKTIEIAREYGCKIIDQLSKNEPSGNERFPIGDFSKERNQLLTHAKEDWFLWIDSDEYISADLHSEIQYVCENQTGKFAYKIKMGLQDPLGKITYKIWPEIYQIRLFNLLTQGKFDRKIHERFVFDQEKFKTGSLHGFWYVPISKPKFRDYKEAVNYRLALSLEDLTKLSFIAYIFSGIVKPLKLSFGIFYRTLMSRILFPFAPHVPIYFLRNRLYSQWVKFRLLTLKYFKQYIQ